MGYIDDDALSVILPAVFCGEGRLLCLFCVDGEVEVKVMILLWSALRMKVTTMIIAKRKRRGNPILLPQLISCLLHDILRHLSHIASSFNH